MSNNLTSTVFICCSYSAKLLRQKQGDYTLPNIHNNKAKQHNLSRLKSKTLPDSITTLYHEKYVSLKLYCHFLKVSHCVEHTHLTADSNPGT